MFVQENRYENVNQNMSAMLPMPQYVKGDLLFAQVKRNVKRRVRPELPWYHLGIIDARKPIVTSQQIIHTVFHNAWQLFRTVFISALR